MTSSIVLAFIGGAVALVIFVILLNKGVDLLTDDSSQLDKTPGL